MEQKYYHSHGNGNIGMKQIKRNNEYLHRSVFKLYLHSVLMFQVCYCVICQFSVNYFYSFFGNEKKCANV